MICLVAGILSLIVGVYWLIRALFYDDTNLIAMLSSICIAIYLITRVFSLMFQKNVIQNT